MASLNQLGYASADLNRAVSTAKPDGLATCLHRMQSIAGGLLENSARLENIANQVGGSVPDISKDSPPQPMPDNALFMARQIEETLQSIMEAQRHSMNRIEDSIS